MERIRTPNAPEAVGAYEQAVLASGEFVFTAGQIGLTPEGHLAEGIEAQTEQTLDNLVAILGAASCRLVDVVSTRIYAVNEKDAPIVNDIFTRRFEGTERGAREFVIVKGIPYRQGDNRALVEMSMIARVPQALGRLSYVDC